MAERAVRLSPFHSRGRRGSSVVAALLLVLLLPNSSRGQFSAFGRNKVQWTNFDWHVLRTDHFDIYYYAGAEELAHRGAAIAEEAYTELVGRFDHSVLRPIPLIFYSSHLHFEQTNTTPGFIPEGVGGFFEFMKGRVVIPSDGSPAQFRHVIRHELVHVFTRSKISRVLADHRQPDDRDLPLWFTEGLAEYWSATWDAQAEMVLRDAVINTYIVPVDEMDRIYGTFLMYKEGQEVCRFLTERYGPATILLLLENFWKAPSFSEVLRLTIGRTYETFDNDWLYALKKRYYPKLAREDLPSGVAKTVVADGFNAKPVVRTVDGRPRVYFIGNRRGYTGIYRVDADSLHARPEQVVEGETTGEFEAFHLFQSKIDISGDSLLAFVTKSGETDVLHLFDLRRSAVVEDLRFRDLVVIGSPSFSPDGSRIVFSAIDRSGANDLYLFDRSMRGLTRMTNDVYDERDPAWSPDGRFIAFSSDRTSFGADGTQNLFVCRVADGRLEYVTSGPHDDRSPAWSPDGRRLAFVSSREGSQNVWIVAMDSGRVSSPAKRVTNFVTAVFDPAWEGPDRLVMSVFERFSFQIRSVSGLSARWDSSSVTAPAVDSLPGEPWIPARLDGPHEARKYDVKESYSLDIAQSQISTDPIFGTTGGAVLAMSDLLGNDQYSFLIFNTARVQSELLDNFNIAISRESVGQRTNYSYGVFRFAGERYDLTDPNVFYYERSFGGYFVLSYPLSKFDRVESGMTVSSSEKEIYTASAPRRALLVSNSLSYIWDTSLWGPSGPLDGARMMARLAYTSDVEYSNVSYYTIMLDARDYERIGDYSAVAVRAQLFYNEGREARRFFMGGSWDLRGWDRWSIFGMKQWLVSAELRVPFVDQLLFRFPFGGLGFGPFRAAVFADFGGSWDDLYTDTKGSVGAGLRMNLFGAFVLRYDIGKRIEENLRHLQTGLFYQFFFGWDF